VPAHLRRDDLGAQDVRGSGAPAEIHGKGLIGLHRVAAYLDAVLTVHRCADKPENMQRQTVVEWRA
jgi:hypothetical protein